jgi:hypothetical protein
MRRLHLSRNTVKKYAAAEHPGQLIHGPKYSTTLVDPFRDYLRQRRAQEPAVPTWTLLGEIKAMGYQGGSTLLYRYLGQGRADGEYPPPSPRRLTSWITTDPAKLPATRQTRLEHALKHCPELQATAGYVRSFAALLTADHDGDLHEHTTRLDAWIEQVRADQTVPALRSFAEGLLIDHDAVAAALALPYSNGPTEGAVNKIILWNLICQVIRVCPGALSRPAAGSRSPGCQSRVAWPRLASERRSVAAGGHRGRPVRRRRLLVRPR